MADRVVCHCRTIVKKCFVIFYKLKSFSFFELHTTEGEGAMIAYVLPG